jgi:hypothetical protein
MNRISRKGTYQKNSFTSKINGIEGTMNLIMLTWVLGGF